MNIMPDQSAKISGHVSKIEPTAGLWLKEFGQSFFYGLLQFSSDKRVNHNMGAIVTTSICHKTWP